MSTLKDGTTDNKRIVKRQTKSQRFTKLKEQQLHPKAKAIMPHLIFQVTPHLVKSAF